MLHKTLKHSLTRWITRGWWWVVRFTRPVRHGVGLNRAGFDKITRPVRPAARWIWERLSASARDARIEEQYDEQAILIMSRVLNARSNCIDVGCSAGLFLEHIVRIAPEGIHYAFEPLPELASRLRERFPQVNVLQVALSDSNGKAAFQYVEDSPGLSGLRVTSMSKGFPQQTLEVSTGRLDDLIPADYRVDFIKIDVEGAELHLFRGAARTIRTWRPFIVFEHGKGGADWYGTTPGDVFDILREYGMSISQLSDWIQGRSPLGRDAFVLLFESHEAWYFLAHRPGQ